MRVLLPLIIAGMTCLATAAVAEDWHPFSRSASAVYLADVDSIAVQGDVTTVRVAIVSLRGQAGDYKHIVDQFAFRCEANEARTIVSADYDEAGDEAERFDEPDAAWEAVRANSFPAFLKEIACDGGRSTARTWPSIKAYVDGGRP